MISAKTGDGVTAVFKDVASRAAEYRRSKGVLLILYIKLLYGLLIIMICKPPEHKNRIAKLKSHKHQFFHPCHQKPEFPFKRQVLK